MTDSLLYLPTYSEPSYRPGHFSKQTQTLINNLKSKPESVESKFDIKSAAKKTADEFETVFINNMVETMFSGINTEAPFGGGQGEKVFRSFLLNEYSKAIQGSGGFGISDQVYTQILALQENSAPINNTSSAKKYNDVQKGESNETVK